MVHMKKTKLYKQNRLFYVLIGVAAALGLWTFSYLILRMNSSLGLLSVHNPKPYFELYLILTIATSILFGINTSLFFYQWRKYGVPNVFSQGGSSGVGAILGLLASSCPVCGVTMLSMLGVVGGLSTLPFNGLELKTLSLLLIGGSVIYSYWWLQKNQCSSANCPIEKDDSLKRPTLAFAAIVLTISLFSYINWNMLKTDQILTPASKGNGLACTTNT